MAIFLNESEENVQRSFGYQDLRMKQTYPNFTYEGDTDPSVTWFPLADILPTLKAVEEGLWKRYRNSRCKYVELRIDMRDLTCLIRDRDGKFINLHQLTVQTGPENQEENQG